MSNRSKGNLILEFLLYPSLLVLSMVILHFLAGTVKLNIDSSDAQRDFNTAIGTALLSGVFLFSIRVIQKQAAKNLYSMLNVIGKRDEFWLHRKKLSEQFAKHLILSVAVSFIMPLLYMLSEGLLVRLHEKEVFIVAVGAIPFWLLLTLFVLQLITVNRYSWKILFGGDIDLVDKLKLYSRVMKMAMITLATIGLVLAVIPVFWINQPIHFFDIATLIFLLTLIVSFLFAPFVYIALIVGKVKYALAKDIDKRVDKLIKESVVYERSQEIEELLYIKEKYCN
ncbi:hypothetical protein C6Y39_16900 [Alteromonas gracilis]|jgi:multisubunit Na+/H+ antiporter MnhG subunit|uniref:Uncharacterized protein n=2 Tax=Alteromonas gracilis TaxID=1479524 RepID=A0ABX5CIH0_9ALTE|nr:hypothetical protein C6Y39_16900 [Alteromonas gracilis]